jgi:hypothetical protein
MNQIKLQASCAVWVLLATVSAAQVGTAGTTLGNHTPGQDLVKKPAQQSMQSGLHQRAAQAGGKLREVREPNEQDLAADLPTMMGKSKEIVLGHVLRTRAVLAADGESVVTEYDVIVLRSWRGRRAEGSLLQIAVPAGIYRFRDGVQAESGVTGFSGLLDGGRYLFFLGAGGVQANPGDASELVGDGVQGALLLDDGRVRPALVRNGFWGQQQPKDVEAVLAQLQSMPKAQ